MIKGPVTAPFISLHQAASLEFFLDRVPVEVGYASKLDG